MKIEFDKSMTCEGVKELLSAFLFEELDLEKQKGVHRHLLSCESCSLIYFDLIESALHSGKLPMPQVPDPPQILNHSPKPELSRLRESFSPGIDNAGDRKHEVLLKFEVPLTRLAAAPRKMEEYHLDIAKSGHGNFIQKNKNGFIITLWEIQEENMTFIGVKLESDLREEYEGHLVTITDREGKQLLHGRLTEGEITDEFSWKIAEIASPLSIEINA